MPNASTDIFNFPITNLRSGMGLSGKFQNGYGREEEESMKTSMKPINTQNEHLERLRDKLQPYHQFIPSVNEDVMLQNFIEEIKVKTQELKSNSVAMSSVLTMS